MKTNYQTELDAVIADLGETRPTLLLHSCCGPCSSYVLEALVPHFRTTVMYYNPCIAPEEEYLHRKAVQLDLIEQLNENGADIGVLDAEYDHGSYLARVAGHENDPEGGDRCTLCFEQRLRRTAEAAKAGSYDWFCTTLTVSPHKDAERLNRIGRSMADETGVPFLPSDFKKKNGYKRSIELSKEYSLYRQDYCGCEFSARPDENDTGEGRSL